MREKMGDPSAPDDWRARAAATRRRRSEERILATARALFDADGYGNVTVESIAARAGVGTATVYNRFGTKAGIVAALFAQAVEPLVEAASQDVEAGVPATNTIERHLVRAAKVLAEHRSIAHALLYALADETQGSEVGAPYTCLTPVFQAPLADLIRAGQARDELSSTVDPDEAAMMASNSLIIRRLSLPRESAVRAGEGVSALFMDGLRPR